MSQGSISLLVPVFNHEKYLPELVASIGCQSRSPQEILFSDDASSDNSARIIEAWAAARQNTRWFRQKINLGITENSNFLLQQSKGDYVLTLHSDDCLRESWALAEMAEQLDQQPDLAMVASPRTRIGEGSEIKKVEQKLPAGRYTRTAILREVFRTEANPLGEPSAVMFRRRALSMGFDPTYRQLWDLKAWIKILESGEVAMLAQPLVSIREHKHQATRSNITSGKMVEEHLRFFAELIPEVDTALKRLERNVLLYKLRKTQKQNKSVVSDKVRQAIAELRNKTSLGEYFLDLWTYRIKKMMNPSSRGHPPLGPKQTG